MSDRSEGNLNNEENLYLVLNIFSKSITSITKL